MVVREREQPDAVADADRLRPRRDRAVEHLGRRAVRELGEEVVLDRPEVREPDFFAEDGLRDDTMVGVALAALVPGCRHRDLVEESEVELRHDASRAQTSVCLHGLRRRDKDGGWDDSTARWRS